MRSRHAGKQGVKYAWNYIDRDFDLSSFGRAAKMVA
jgi:hypothetical protein